MYDNTTPVIPEAFTLIQKFLANKKGSDQVFDHVQPEVRIGTRLGRGAAPHTRAQKPERPLFDRASVRSIRTSTSTSSRSWRG